MYVCNYVRMYICTYVRMYVCTYVRMYGHTNVRVCTYVCMYSRVYVCMYVCMHVSHVALCLWFALCPWRSPFHESGERRMHNTIPVKMITVTNSQLIPKQ